MPRIELRFIHLMNGFACVICLEFNKMFTHAWPGCRAIEKIWKKKQKHKNAVAPIKVMVREETDYVWVTEDHLPTEEDWATDRKP